MSCRWKDLNSKCTDHMPGPEAIMWAVAGCAGCTASSDDWVIVSRRTFSSVSRLWASYRLVLCPGSSRGCGDALMWLSLRNSGPSASHQWQWGQHDVISCISCHTYNNKLTVPVTSRDREPHPSEMWWVKFSIRALFYYNNSVWMNPVQLLHNGGLYP